MKANGLYERASTDIFGPFPSEKFIKEDARGTGFTLFVTEIYPRFTKLYFETKMETQEISESLVESFNACSKPEFQRQIKIVNILA